MTKSKLTPESIAEELHDLSIPNPPDVLPALPLRDTVVYPNTMFPILVGRDTSLAAINQANEEGQFIFLITQKDGDVEEPTATDLYKVGTVAYINQILHLPNNVVKILVSGLYPARIKKVVSEKPYFVMKVDPQLPTSIKMTSRLQSLIKRSRESFERYVMTNSELPEEILIGFEQNDDPFHQMFLMASHLDLELVKKQELLELKSLESQYKELLVALTGELEFLSVSEEINERVQEEIQESQKRFFIQEQIKALQDELEDGEFGDPELIKIKQLLEEKEIPAEIKTKAYEELDRLKKTPQMSPEYGVSRNYLDWIVSMPWGTLTEDDLDIEKVHGALDEDHFGLEKPKERILEHIAVLNLVKELKGQILCFVGPPGTGKTSLAKSIARSMSRNMVRIALGGIHDEAEIRGHRKTYIGSMPGRIVQAIKKAGSMNPVIILDEIDKIGSDFRGDPSSAILEVLDPEQNNTFNDHYLDIDLDLSKVMFITTANVASNIQPALLDRMEIIRLPGYLEHDKLEIAKKHLIPKGLKNHGLESFKIEFKDEAVYKIIREYTAEAGVRSLEQQLFAICRKLAKQVVLKKAQKKRVGKIKVDDKLVVELLGVEKYKDRSLEKKDQVGSVNGLAWTSTGGSILQIEVSVMPGKSKILLTGQLGDVMKESAQAALTWVRSHYKDFDLADDYFEKNELHLHVPEGAVPKDGPSAGISMATAIVSLLTQKLVRHNIAMTGEITLRGEVLPIGGLNEKLLAAQRNRIHTVIIPKDNEKDLREIPDKVKEGLNIVGVSNVTEVLKLALIS